MPCGVQITRIEHINALSRDGECLPSGDATIMGSYNGHAPIFVVMPNVIITLDLFFLRKDFKRLKDSGNLRIDTSST